MLMLMLMLFEVAIIHLDKSNVNCEHVDVDGMALLVVCMIE